MPLFRDAKKPVSYWFPGGRIAHMESAPGGLTTNVIAILLTPKGENVIAFEAEGRIETLGAALDSGEPTEVGQ